MGKSWVVDGSAMGDPMQETETEKEKETEKKEEHESGSFLPEETGLDVKTFAAYPIKSSGGRKEFRLCTSKVDEWVETFGSRGGVESELRKARQWLLDNPSKQKTERGMVRFLGSWLGRVNDRRGFASSPEPPKPSASEAPVREQSRWQEILEEAGVSDIPKPWIAAFAPLEAYPKRLDAIASTLARSPRMLKGALGEPEKLTTGALKALHEDQTDRWPIVPATNGVRL